MKREEDTNYGPVIDADRCVGCNSCVEICPANIIIASEMPDEPPVIKYRDECHYHYLCMMICPVNPPAVRIVHPLDMRLSLRRVK